MSKEISDPFRFGHQPTAHETQTMVDFCNEYSPQAFAAMYGMAVDSFWQEGEGAPSYQQLLKAIGALLTVASVLEDELTISSVEFAPDGTVVVGTEQLVEFGDELPPTLRSGDSKKYQN